MFMIIIFVSTPFIMLVVNPLLPENAFLPLQLQSSFTYAILIFCIQFTLFYLLFTQSKTQKHLFYKIRILSCYLEHYLVLLFQNLIQELLDFGLLLPVGSISLFRNMLQMICALAVINGLPWSSGGARTTHAKGQGAPCLFLMTLLCT